MRHVRLLVSVLAATIALGGAAPAHALFDNCSDPHDIEVHVYDKCVLIDVPDLPPLHRM